MVIRLTDLAPLLALGTTGSALDAPLGDSSTPLLLLPVRLETRFGTRADGGPELLVRVYPDKVHLDSHEHRLSVDELTWGKHYWRIRWRADEEAHREAWRGLAGRFGPARAEWIARQLTPTSPPSAEVPAFPDLGPPATTRGPAVARLLPDRWIATVFSGGAMAELVTGRDLVPDLAVGPDLDAPVLVDDDENVAVDEGMRWMVDFGRAEEVGMALRVPLEAPAVDLLLVAGVRAADATEALATQLAAQRYTDGLAFLPPAAPSNNTAVGRTPYGQPDPDQHRSFAAVFGPATVKGSNAERTALAFGLPGGTPLAGVDGATRDEQQVESAMATALWPVTWGYFLAQMVGFDRLTVAGRDWVRAHALAHVHPGGPLPLLRVGRQPYGVLPVTSLDAWLPIAGDPGGPLQELLVSLRDHIWRPASTGSSRIGRSDDPAADLVDVLQSRAVSDGFAVRGVMGRHYLQHLRAFLGEDLDGAGFWTRLVELTAALPARLGLGFLPALASAVYEETTHPVTAQLVGDPAAIGGLLSTGVDALAMPVPTEPAPLLIALLRHALLRTYDEAAARLLASVERPLEQLLRDEELVGLLPGRPASPTWRWRREQLVDGRRIADRVEADPAVVELRAALKTLAAADGDTLERHLAGGLDAAAHRLDAWVTSLATRRLAELRKTNPRGVRVGGYAWVEGLRAAPPGQPVEGVADEPGPVLALPGDPGFVHAPSLNQASAAALLRNAHLASGGQPTSPYATELTSSRIRVAKRLFEGVRQGLPLGELLGYLFERELSDIDREDLIDKFRQQAPQPGAATPTGVRRLVVDGLALARRWQSDRSGLLSAVGVADDISQRDVLQALDTLLGAVDAAADSIQAEAAFQMVRGNPARAAASLDAIATGSAAPPELGFLNTPRTGTAVTHRVVMVLDPLRPAEGDGWRRDTPRALVDPALDAWAARLLGPAAGVVAHVQELAPDGSVTDTHLVPLSELGLAAVDLIWAGDGAEGEPAEVVARVLDAAARAADGPDATAALRVDLSRQPGESRSLGDLVEVASRAQRLLAGARPLDGADLLPPHADPARGLDLDEFGARVAGGEQALAAAAAALASAAASGGDVRAAMLAVAGFGVPAAVPALGIAVAAQVPAVLAETARRLAPPASAEPADEVARRDWLLERLRLLFGAGFLALPRFAAANAPELESSRADAAQLLGDDSLAAYTWLLRMARVRTPLARLSRVLTEAEVLGSPERLDLAVAQVPHHEKRRWIGLEVAEGSDGQASVVLQGAPATLSGPLAGVLVDEWSETVPSRQETTGIAFQYDPPDVTAPQALLLAVPPVIGEPWTVGRLNRVLLETLDLARLRTVEPPALGEIAHYLPAVQLAFNADADTVSTDLNLLAP